MAGVTFQNSVTVRRGASLALACTLLFALACHRGRGGGDRTGRLTPVDGECGLRSGVAVYRGKAPRGSAARTGALVVRLAPADTGLVTPEGPVRLAPAARATEARVLPAAARGVSHSGPLPAGRYVVEATGTGYRPRRFTVAIRPGATDTLRIRLQAMCVRRG
jgi:hypothetical protein